MGGKCVTKGVIGLLKKKGIESTRNFCALCVLCKNEEQKILRDLITCSKINGFENVIIYDGAHNSSLEVFFNNEIREGYVIYNKVKFEDNIKQNVYKECYETYKKKFKWIAFFDIDEKLVLKKHSNIKEYLSQDKFKSCDIIQLDRKTKIVSDKKVISHHTNDFVKCIVHCKNEKTLVINPKYRYVTNTLSAQKNNVYVNGRGDIVNKNGECNNSFDEVYIEQTHSLSFNDFLTKLKKGNPKENRFGYICLSYIEEKLREYFKYVDFTNEHLKQINNMFPEYKITKKTIFEEIDLSTKTDIDYVFPYVDDTDEVWYKEYCKYKGVVDYKNDTIAGASRYKTYDLLKYKLRSIEKNMPWINNIYMIVASPSQVPKWLDTTKIKIVYHKDIIPEEFLPTFNSSTIEMFLGNIDGLSEKFIYGNDDFYVLQPVMPYMFFRGDKPLLYLKERNMLKKSKLGVSLIADAFIKNDIDVAKVGTKYESINKLFQPDHNIKPMLKSSINEVINNNKNIIYSGCTMFRDFNNFNQYLYHYYNIFNDNYISYERKTTGHAYLDDYEILEEKFRYGTLFSLDFVSQPKENDINNITNLFNDKFPKESKYEKKLNVK